MSDETERENLARASQLVKLESAERMYRGSDCYHAIVLMAEYERRGAERDEALGLLRELVAWVIDPAGSEVPLWLIEERVERTSQGGE